MDAIDALKYFEEIEFIDKWGPDEADNGGPLIQQANEARLAAIAALKKQVARTPLKKDLSHYEDGSLCLHFEHYCPVCRHLVESVYDYCGFCGQQIKK